MVSKLITQGLGLFFYSLSDLAPIEFILVFFPEEVGLFVDGAFPGA
jgi:hypothetical protein